MRRYLVLSVSAALMMIPSADAYGQQVFTEVSEEMGFSGQTGLGHSVAWCDLNGDDLQDVAFSNQDGSGFWLYANRDGYFEDITSSAGLGGVSASRILWAELTGDGLRDLVLDTGSGQALYKNLGNEEFADITPGSGLTGSPIAAADFDRDGSADLLTITSSGCAVLYNDGTGGFTQETISAESFYCGVCLDYDGDGDDDVYLGTYGDYPNALLRNDGSGFTDVTSGSGAEWNGGTSGVAAGDYDNDGWTDLYLGNTSSPGCKLFRNNGDGTFDDVTSAAGVTGYTDTRTPSFVDYNNDGWLDIFVSNHDFYVNSNQMYRNEGDGTFTEVGEQLGLSGEMMGDYFGTGWADFDLDGDPDLFAAGHIDKYNLFRNDMGETMPAAYLTLDLEGTESSYCGIGAVVTAHLGSMVLTRTVRAGQGMHDFHSLPVELGLYDCTEVQTLEVAWPSGIVDSYANVAADQYITVVEGDSLYTGLASGPASAPQLGSVRLVCRPNPFSGELVVTVEGMAASGSGLEVYDLSGRRVRRLDPDSGEAGGRDYLWDGRDGSGQPLPEGVYLIRTGHGAGGCCAAVTLLR